MSTYEMIFVSYRCEKGDRGPEAPAAGEGQLGVAQSLTSPNWE